MQQIPTVTIVVIVFALIILSNAIKILREYERGVVFRLGRLISARGPGLILLIPVVDKMIRVSLRTIVLDAQPQEMQRAMAKQAEAERERRSKVIAAEGEFQASQRLADAAAILSDQPSALTLRYLQTLREIATEKNSTTIFPVPIDLLKPFLKMEKK